jgi:endonuclease G
MNMRNSILTFATFVFLSLFSACKKDDGGNSIQPQPTDTSSSPIVFYSVQDSIMETFESAGKTDYRSATIKLKTGKWNFTDAVIGETSDDKKTGTRSARLRNNGTINMNFDLVCNLANIPYTITISHALYGNSQPCDWELWASTDTGKSYLRVGNTKTTASYSLRTDTFVIVAPKSLRFSVRKISGATDQINIDNFKVTLKSTPIPPSYVDDDNLLMGNPTNANVVSDDNLYLDQQGYYVLSYNRSNAVSNWASWHLDARDLGSARRQDDFRVDPQLPSNWYRVGASDYDFSTYGFDRGHMCPSADRTSTVGANSATFVMTNMMPQAPSMNQITWSAFENYTRDSLVRNGKECFLICGPRGSGGTGSKGYFDGINNGLINVPAGIWKVIVVLPDGNNDLSRVDNNTRVIAVLMPNDNSVNGSNWRNYRVSVDAIENFMGGGFDLLSNLPVAVQQVLESKVDAL